MFFGPELFFAFVVAAVAGLVRLPALIRNRKNKIELSPEERRRDLMFWMSLLVFLLGILDWSGIICTLVLAFWCGVWAWRLAPRWTLVLPLIGIAGLLIAHSSGYKVYGSAVIVDNGPLLHQPLTVDWLEPPNIVVATDGSRHRVAGIEFSALLNEFPREQVRSMLGEHGSQVQFVADPASPSGYAAQRWAAYICGNSFIPGPLPKRLPRYEKGDLAVLLPSWAKQR